MSAPAVTEAPGGFGGMDPRLAALLPPGDWDRLAAEVQRRFAGIVPAGQSRIHEGRTTAFRLSPLGRAIAWVCRILGGALPMGCDAGGAATVVITADPRGGQVWTRLYASRLGYPQVIQSSKRFAGPTGLEEHVGRGLGMTLRLSTEGDTLVFTSDRFFATVARRRVYLPRWIAPGRLTVRHQPLGPRAFRFVLDLRHPVFGGLVHHTCIFGETQS